MPTLAGWLTGEQVPTEIIEQTIRAMESVLELHGGQPARYVQPGVGLVVFADKAYAMQRNDEPPVMDWVPERRTLVYRRPLSGWHPLYYVENWPAEGNLVFASEIKALLALGVPRHLNLAALSALHRYGFIPAPLTAFKEIHVVPAGSILRWQHTKLVVNASTDYHLQEMVDEADEAAVTERVHSLLKHAIEGQLPRHDQLAALTDGGAASMLTTLLSAQATEARFTIASFSAKKAPKQWKIVEQLANVCQRPSLAITGLDHLDFWQAVLAATEAPCVDSLPLALHQLLQTVAAETGARVAMSGLGARIILGEGGVCNAPPAPLRDEQHMLNGYRSRANSGKLRELPWTAEVQQRLQDEESWEDGHYARRLAHKAGQLTDEWQRDYYLDLHLRLPDSLVGPSQQLATLACIALRSPFLHPDVLSYLTRLSASPAAKDSRSALLPTLVRQLQPELVPVTTKSTFSLNLPLQLLLQESGHELLEITLSSEALHKRGLFTAEGVQLLRQQRKISPELLLVFTTQLFCHLYDATL